MSEHHKHKSSSSTTTTGVYTGHEGTPLLGSGGSKSESSGRCSKKCGTIVFIVVVFVLLLVGGGVAFFLTLPQTFTCNAEESGYYSKLIDPPEIEKADPPVVCARHPVPITIYGNHFVTLDNKTLPNMSFMFSTATVREEDIEISDYNISNCNSLHIRRRDEYQTCKELGMVASFPVEPNYKQYSVIVEVTDPIPPQPVIGSNDDDNSTCNTMATILTVIPSPGVSSVSPSFICRGDSNVITIDGHYFVQARKTGASEDNVPSFTICQEEAKIVDQITQCTDLPQAVGYDYIRSCNNIAVETTAQSCSPLSAVGVDITNPDPGSCPAEYPSNLNIPVTDKPSVSSVDKTLLCAVNGAPKASLQISGGGFVRINGQGPVVSFNDATATSVTGSECSDFVVGNTNVSICSHLAVDVPEHTPTTIEAVTMGIASSLMTCASVVENLVYYAPAPVVNAVTPRFLCHSDNAQNVTLDGSFVVDKNNKQISVLIGETAATKTYLDGCTESTVGTMTVLSCTKLLFELPPSTPYGPLSITVSSVCTTTVAKENFYHIPIPKMTAISQSTVCSVAINTIEITGENFVSYNNSAVVPHVVFAGNVEADSVKVDGCTGDPDFQVCTKLSFSINGASLTAPTTTFTISNVDPACGGSQVAGTLPVAGAPVVTDYDKSMCEGGGSIKVTGSGFRADALEFILKSDAGSYKADLSSVTETSFVAGYAAGSIPAGVYSVIIRSSPVSECTAAVSSTVTVYANDLLVINMEPSLIVAASGISQTVVLQTRAFVAIPVYIKLVSEKRTLFYNNQNITIADNNYDRFFLPLPTDLEAGESFSVSLQAQTTCATSADKVLSVTNTKTGSLNEAPAVVSSQISTVITFSAPTATEASFSVDDVISVFAASTDKMYELGDPCVSQDGTTISARIVSGSLSEGKYSLYVTRANTGEYWDTGVPLTINSHSPPSITSIVPSLLPVADNTPVTVYGTNFDTTATYTAEIRCRGSDPVAAKQATASSDTQLNVILPALSSTVDHKSCLFVVHDSNDYIAEFNGVSVSSNYDRPNTILEDQHKLPVALCGASAVTATIGDRQFIYVIGGDTDKSCLGTSPVSSVYFAEVDDNKDDKSLLTSAGWLQSDPLPFANSFAQVQVIDTFVYVLGGYDRDAKTARNTVLRAQVLQPSNAPTISAYMRADAKGQLAVGHYLYAVTAVYASDDDINPNGQSLRSNVASVYVAKVSATPYLKWTRIDDDMIISYRIFRAKEDPSGTKWVIAGEVTGTEFQDLGATVGEGEPPVLGSLGKWATMSTPMHVARCGHVSTTFNPLGVGTLHYLFSFGGANSPSPSDKAFDNYESCKITVTAEVPGGKRQAHTLNPWSDGTTALNGQHLWSGVMLDKNNMYYSQYQAVILGPGSENITEHQMNYAQNNDVFLKNPFKQYDIGHVNAFGYCMFVHDQTLTMIGGSKKDGSGALVPVKTISVMQMSEEEPPNPLTDYHDSGDVLRATVFSAYTQVAGYLVIIGGRDVDELSRDIQFLPG